MFAFSDYPADLFPNDTVKELTYVYVAASFRSMGVGSTLITIAKEKAKELGASMLVFDTLTPLLNRFYESKQGREIGEYRFLGAPTTFFRMDIDTTITDEDMANSVFGEQSNTARRLRGV